jgi:hypothetical protein
LNARQAPLRNAYRKQSLPYQQALRPIVRQNPF